MERRGEPNFEAGAAENLVDHLTLATSISNLRSSNAEGYLLTYHGKVVVGCRSKIIVESTK